MMNTDKAEQQTGGGSDAPRVFKQDLGPLPDYKAHAERLAEALREMALVSIWGKSSPILVRATEALAAWEGAQK